MAIRPRQLRLRNSTTVALGAALLLISGLAFAGGGTFTGPTPYLSRADSPFAAELNAGHVYLEDFECGSILVPGVTPSSGSVIPPGFEGLIDSVDADDGVIDGSGLSGHSFFTSNSVTFTFDQTTLGAFPTVAGIVWTDGDTPVTFEAFDSVGASLGTIGPVLLQDGSNAGGTAEDRVFGVTFAGGISKITISNAGGLEVDHLQYGLYQNAVQSPCGVLTATPTPIIAGSTPTPTVIPATAVPPTATPTVPFAATPVVPTLSFPMLALLGLALGGAALFLIRRT